MESPRRTLSRDLKATLAHHQVEIAADAFEAIDRIDCASRPYDVIFCDVASAEVPGPELWAYLSLGRAVAAQRMVFVATSPVSVDTRAFLSGIPNHCVELPADADAIEALVRRRAAA